MSTATIARATANSSQADQECPGRDGLCSVGGRSDVSAIKSLAPAIVTLLWTFVARPLNRLAGRRNLAPVFLVDLFVVIDRRAFPQHGIKDRDNEQRADRAD